MQPAEKAAKDILATLEATYQPTHHYVRVSPQNFRHLDLAFYDKTAKTLGDKGFRTLADVEDTTITNTPGGVLMPVMVRSMISRDGTIMASLYHPRIRTLGIRLLLWLLRKLPGKVVDMETECTDGSFVVTTNAAGAAAIDMPALIASEYLPASANAEAVRVRHAERLTAHLAARPGVTAKVIASHDDLVASQNRMNALKAAYRGQVGGITREELDRLAVFGKSLAADVHAAIEREQFRRAS